MLKRCPALRVVILLIVGIFFAEFFSVDPVYSFIFSIAFLLIAILCVILRVWLNYIDILLQCLLILTGCFVHSFNLRNFYSAELSSDLGNEQVVLWGKIDSKPYQEWNKITYIVKCDSILRAQRIDKTKRRIYIKHKIFGNENLREKLHFGIMIKLKGVLEQFPFARNPGEFDYGNYLRINDIHGVISTKGTDCLEILDSSKSLNPETILYYVRDKLYSAIDSLHAPVIGSFLKGIIFGYRTEIPNDIKQAFIDTGTIHILAVSGSNVAFIAFVFYVIFGFIRVPRKAIKILTIFGVIVYMLIVGSSASVVRATIMIIVLILASVVERKTDIYNSISLAGLIILLLDTKNLFDVGFQLSFSAVLSIVYFYPFFARAINSFNTERKWTKIIVPFLKIVAVSISAQLGTIPITIYYFNRASIISLVANTFVVPVSGLNIFIGTTEIILSNINIEVAKCYAAVNDLLVYCLLKLLKIMAELPLAYVEVWTFNWFYVFIYFLILIGIFNFNKRKIIKPLLILLLLCFNIILYQKIIIGYKSILKMVMMDVGEGESILLKFPNGKWILIDTGPKYGTVDAGKRSIVPFLKRNGISQIEYMILTHSHKDHIGGAISILENCKVDTLVLNMDSTKNNDLKNIACYARKRNVGIRGIFKGQYLNVDTNARLYVIHPSKEELRCSNANNTSIVIKVCFGNTSALLTGDVEKEMELKIRNRYGNFLISNILKVAHHGSETGTSEDLLNIVKPSIALISSGIGNRFNHPSGFVINRLKAHTIRIERTDEQGAIIYESDGYEWRKINWR